MVHFRQSLGWAIVPSKPFPVAEKTSPPFYWLFNAQPSLEPYKVVWKRIGGGITGKALGFAAAVVVPHDDSTLGARKVVIPDGGTLIMVPLEDEKEAFYLCGILNSAPILFAISSYTYELRMETHITQTLQIPKFDNRIPSHSKLAELSKEAHRISSEIALGSSPSAAEKLLEVEERIDHAVSELYKISDEELDEIRRTLKLMKEGPDITPSQE